MSFKWNKGLRGRMALLVGIASLSILILNFVSYRGQKNVAEAIDMITKVRMPSIKGLEAMNEGQTAVQQALALIEYNEGANAQQLWAQYAEKRKQITEGFKLYEPLPQSPDEEEEYKTNFTKVWPAWEKAVDDYERLEKNDDHAKAQEAFKTLTAAWGPADASLQKLIDINYKNADLDKAAAEASSSAAQTTALILGASGVLFIALFGLILAHRTSDMLSQLSSQLFESSSQVASSSTQIASSSQELSQSSTEQAASLEETAASLEQISAMIAKATDSANTTAQSSEDSQKKAAEGRVSVDKMLTSMEEINQSNTEIMHQINESNQQMSEIVKVIQEIGTKTRVINDIVFQTKLLSFNASVEAARAGEHGKGFAVVAEEVGNLAQMSGNAAREITQMLDGSISRVEIIVNDTKSKVENLVAQGRRKVEAGVHVARQCSDVLNEIVQNVNTVSGLAQDISQASREQSLGVSEINKAMGQLDSVTQQNSAASEETAGAAEELAAQAETMKNAVQKLLEVVDGDSSTSPASSSSEPRHQTHRNATVIPMRTRSAPSGRSHSLQARAAVGGGTPSRDDKGFEDL